MSITAQDLIDSALRALGVAASGEVPTTTERNDGLVTLNQLIASWSAEALPIPYLVEEGFTFTGLSLYPIGPGATFNTARPLAIRAAGSQVGLIENPMEILTAEQWTAIKDKSRAGLFANAIFYNPVYPSGIIHVWPIPTTGGGLHLTSYKALLAFASLATTVDFPPGYERALRMCLALEFAPEYGRVTDLLTAQANEAKQSIFGLNAGVLGMPKPVGPQPPPQQAKG